MPDPLPRNDELLSAYLDGELTEAERVEVEAWLAEDPQARTLVDELQGVSAAVKSLPAATLRTDLAAQVLEQVAARETPSGDRNGSDHEAAPAIPPSEPRRGFPGRGFSGRGVWWSAAAIAAAVLIALFVPQDGVQDQRPIARKDPPATAAPRLTAPDDEMPVASAPEPAGEEPLDMAAEPLDQAAPLTTESVPPPLVRSDAPAPPAPEPMAPSREAATARLEVAPQNPPPQALGDARSDSLGVDDREASQYLVVWVDVPPQALERRTLERVLVSNNIAVDAQADDWDVAAEPVRRHVASRVATGDNLARPAEPATPDAAAEDADPRADSGEAILVEASWPQIAQTLADMRQDQLNFTNLTIETVAPPPGAESLDAKGESPEAEQPVEQRERDLAEGETPPVESPPTTASQGRFSAPLDRGEEKIDSEARDTPPAGRARRLTRFPLAQSPAAKATYGARQQPATSGTQQAETQQEALEPEAAPPASEQGESGQVQSEQAPPETAPDTSRQQGPEGRRGGQGQQSPAPLRKLHQPPMQVLFVLRSRPPEIAGEASPAPPQPAQPAPAQPAPAQSPQ